MTGLPTKIPVAFQQIAANIDRYGEFVNTNGAAGALLSSDMNWENRMIVRLLQKHEIPNMVLMNGWFGTRHMVENKSADKALCFRKQLSGPLFQQDEGRENRRLSEMRQRL